MVEKIPGDNLHLQLLFCKLWIFVKENPHRKKNKKVNYALQHIRTGSRCMVDEERLESFATDVPIMQKPVHCLENKSMDWFLYDRNFRHERVYTLLLACIH